MTIQRLDVYSGINTLNHANIDYSNLKETWNITAAFLME